MNLAGASWTGFAISPNPTSKVAARRMVGCRNDSVYRQSHVQCSRATATIGWPLHLQPPGSDPGRHVAKRQTGARRLPWSFLRCHGGLLQPWVSVDRRSWTPHDARQWGS
jgi:hypothetical protein